MKKIKLHSFPGLDNYGTGMMGLVTIRRLQQQLGVPVRFDVDFAPHTDIAEIQAELGVGPDVITLHRSPPVEKWPSSRAGQALHLASLMTTKGVQGYDMVIFLGGDDLSEYYTRAIWKRIFALRQWGLHAPLVLLGQTVGPFRRPINRFAARQVFRSTHIFPRDKWCTSYLADNLRLPAECIRQSTDLAFADLPLQHDTAMRDEILRRYGLIPDQYCTLIVSGMQKGGYYTSDRTLYLQRYKEIAEGLLRADALAGRKLCLLAHTYGTYGDEAANIDDLLPLIDPTLRDRITPVTERVLPTRARFILGHGLFTITGRMHPAVSTFQMGKPAISLAYSQKYEGVLGTMLGRSDLIVDANDPALWENGAIVGMTLEKARYALDNQERLGAEIRTAIAAQKQIVDDTFTQLHRLIIGNARAESA